MQRSTLVSATAEQIAVAQPAAARRGHAATVWRGIGPGGRVGLCIVGVYVLIAACAPVLAPHDSLQIFSGQLRKPPSAQFLMGTDEVGRDILSRVIVGSRTSMRVGLIAVVIAATCGTALGLA